MRRRQLLLPIVLGAATWSTRAHADEPGPHLTVDPVTDGVLTGVSIGLSDVLGMVLSTGEIRPSAGTLDSSRLLPFDRAAVTQTFDTNAGTISDIGLWASTTLAVVDTAASGLRDGFKALVVDGTMYAESSALTSLVTDFSKIAVRRPRPIDYQNPSSTNTDRVLSFPSGHASGVASVSATATYLAFVRAPRSPRPWITLTVGTLLTAFVGYERVRAGAHFPTDVLAGSLLGGSIGVLVPHLHRVHNGPEMIWVGLAPASSGQGASIGVQGRF